MIFYVLASVAVAVPIFAYACAEQVGGRGVVHKLGAGIFFLGILLGAPMVVIGGWGNPAFFSERLWHFVFVMGGLGLWIAPIGAAIFVLADGYLAWRKRRQLFPFLFDNG